MMHIREHRLPMAGTVPLRTGALRAGVTRQAHRRTAGFRAVPMVAKGRFFRIADFRYFDFAGLSAAIAWLEIILAAKGFPVPYGAGVPAIQNCAPRLQYKPPRP
jgi:hypothetical protein